MNNGQENCWVQSQVIKASESDSVSWTTPVRWSEAKYHSYLSCGLSLCSFIFSFPGPPSFIPWSSQLLFLRSLSSIFSHQGSYEDLVLLAFAIGPWKSFAANPRCNVIESVGKIKGYIPKPVKLTGWCGGTQIMEILNFKYWKTQILESHRRTG
jgi:hypothetical protein